MSIRTILTQGDPVLNKKCHPVTRFDDKLADLLRGMNCHVNLIPVNRVKERSYRTARSGVADFAKRLGQRGINATVRRTLGSDIEAACGQLRRDAGSEGGLHN